MADVKRISKTFLMIVRFLLLLFVSAHTRASAYADAGLYRLSSTTVMHAVMSMKCAEYRAHTAL